MFDMQSSLALSTPCTGCPGWGTLGYPPLVYKAHAKNALGMLQRTIQMLISPPCLHAILAVAPWRRHPLTLGGHVCTGHAAGHPC